MLIVLLPSHLGNCSIKFIDIFSHCIPSTNGDCHVLKMPHYDFQTWLHWYSVSKGSGEPSVSLGGKQTEGLGPSHEPTTNPNRVTCAGFLPGWDTDPLCFGRVDTRQQIYFSVALTSAQISYLSSNSIVTWSICRFSSFSRSSTSRFQICNWANIRWITVK